MRRALVAAAAALVLAGAGSSALAARGPLPKLATAAPFHERPRFAVRPRTIWYTGDDTGIVGQLPRGAPAVGDQPGFLHWTTWTRQRAYAVGTLWLKNCVPDCATSRFYRFAVTVTATQSHAGHFVKMTLRYRYRGKRVVDTRCTFARSTFAYWTLPSNWPEGTKCSGPGVA